MTRKEKSTKGIFSKISHTSREIIGVLVILIFGCFLVSYFLDSVEYAFTSECAEGESRTLYCYENVEATVIRAQKKTGAKRRMYLEIDLQLDDGRTKSSTFHYYENKEFPQPKDVVNVEIWRGKVVNIEKDGKIFNPSGEFWLNFSKMSSRLRWTYLLIFVGILFGITGFLFRRKIAQLFS